MICRANRRCLNGSLRVPEQRRKKISGRQILEPGHSIQSGSRPRLTNANRAVGIDVQENHLSRSSNFIRFGSARTICIIKHKDIQSIQPKADGLRANQTSIGEETVLDSIWTSWFLSTISIVVSIGASVILSHPCVSYRSSGRAETMGTKTEFVPIRQVHTTGASNSSGYP